MHHLNMAFVKNDRTISSMTALVFTQNSDGFSIAVFPADIAPTKGSLKVETDNSMEQLSKQYL